MVDIAKFFLEFTVDESCGKCTPCRVGTKRLLEILNKITKRQGHARRSSTSSKSSATTLRTTPSAASARQRRTRFFPHCKYFRDEYIAHVIEQALPGRRLQGPARITSSIADKCKGCTLCARNCPVGAISGTVREPHVIDTQKCIKCGACREKCKFGAIEKK